MDTLLFKRHYSCVTKRVKFLSIKFQLLIEQIKYNKTWLYGPKFINPLKSKCLTFSMYYTYMSDGEQTYVSKKNNTKIAH